MVAKKNEIQPTPRRPTTRKTGLSEQQEHRRQNYFTERARFDHSYTRRIFTRNFSQKSTKLVHRLRQAIIPRPSWVLNRER